MVKVTSKDGTPTYTVELEESNAVALSAVLALFRFPAKLDTGLFGLRNALDAELDANGAPNAEYTYRIMQSGRLELRTK